MLLLSQLLRNKASSARKGREGQGRGEKIRKALGQQSCLPSQDLLQSRGPGRVCGPPTHRALQTHIGAKAVLRGATHSSLVPRVRREELRMFKHSRGGITSNAKALRHPQLEKQTDKLGEPGVLPVSRDRSGGRQLPGVKRWPHPSSVGLRSPKKLHTALELCGGGVSAK